MVMPIEALTYSIFANVALRNIVRFVHRFSPLTVYCKELILFGYFSSRSLPFIVFNSRTRAEWSNNHLNGQVAPTHFDPLSHKSFMQTG